MLISSEEVGLADLDAGSVRPVDLATIFTAGHPELEPIAGLPIPDPLIAVSLDNLSIDTVDVPPDQPLVVWEPLTFRLDGGRVLTWVSESGCHAELDSDSLQVLDLLRTARTPNDLEQLVPGVDIDLVSARLVSLRLIKQGQTSTLEDQGSSSADAVPQSDGSSDEVGAGADAPKEHAVALSGVRRRPAAVASANSLHVETAGLTEEPSTDGNGASPEVQNGRTGGHRVSAWLKSISSRSHPVAAGQIAAGQDAADQDVPESGQVTAGLVPADDAQSRIPVIPLYYFGKVVQTDGLIEPSLAVGMLLAYARTFGGGRLNEKYDFHKMLADPETAFTRWAESPVPAVFVFPDYIWSVERNLALSKRIKAISPESLCVHGGPSSPKYHADSLQFFADNDSVDAAARGEGEETFAALLDALDGDLSPSGVDRLESVTGITFRRRTAGREIVRNPDRPRPVELATFPSPYLTGEFDELLEHDWRWATLETNRGCPYGCTFCDWGSATSARVRKFDLEQVKDEIEWILSNVSTSMILVADANFGIFARDVEIVEHVIELKKTYPQLTNLVFTGLAKNTVKYTQQIYRLLYDANLTIISSPLSIQSADEEVLEAVDRKNIKLERYDDLAETFRAMSIPMMTDLIIGLPGSSIRSFKHDLQFCFDREITPRVFPLLMLPNSPMNAPEYREKYQIKCNEKGQVVSTSTFDEADLRRMEHLRLIFRGGDHYGVLRYLFQYIQWDHGILASELADAIDLAIIGRGNRYPLVAFFGRLFDLYTMPPVAWEPFYDEITQILEETFGIEVDSALRSVVELHLALAPQRGRLFPTVVHLEHDFVSYRADHLEDSEAGPLASYGPAEIAVDDPGQVCSQRLIKNVTLGDRQLEFENLFWNGLDWEMSSPLARRMFSNDYLFAAKSEPALVD
ncbi:MAG: radical SAM protein [Microthrixaceae bacterium]